MHKWGYLMNTQDPKYQQKSKSMSSPEQNYFFRYATRYPVFEAEGQEFAKYLKSLERFIQTVKS